MPPGSSEVLLQNLLHETLHPYVNQGQAKSPFEVCKKVPSLAFGRGWAITVSSASLGKFIPTPNYSLLKEHVLEFSLVVKGFVLIVDYLADSFEGSI